MRCKSTMRRAEFEFQCRRDYAKADGMGKRRQNDHIMIERLVRAGVNRKIAERYVVFCRKKAKEISI